MSEWITFARLRHREAWTESKAWAELPALRAATVSQSDAPAAHAPAALAA